MLHKSSALLTATALSVMLTGCSSASQDGRELHGRSADAGTSQSLAAGDGQAITKIPPPARDFG